MIDPNEKIKSVELTAPNPEWPQAFIESATEIKTILGHNCIDIHHIGSTAIPNIYAKPIVDVLPVVKDIKLVDSLNSKFEALGYVCMGEYGISGRRFYWKSKDKRTHNIHLFEQGASEILRHLSFRDFMRKHEDYAKAYSVLKCCLAEVFSDDIENYVNGKSSFVQMIDYQTGTARDMQLNAQDNVIIQPYNSAWPKLATAEINAIKTIAYQESFVSIDHIGSTAVPELSSKPIIDIFISVESIKEAAGWISPLQSLGYIYWEENPDKTHLRFFKGMPPFGEKRTHHIHIVESNKDIVEHRLLFRDILRSDKRARVDYESLKIKLAQSHDLDRETYTDKKLEFITSILRANGYLIKIEPKQISITIKRSQNVLTKISSNCFLNAHNARFWTSSVSKEFVAKFKKSLEPSDDSNSTTQGIEKIVQEYTTQNQGKKTRTLGSLFKYHLLSEGITTQESIADNSPKTAPANA